MAIYTYRCGECGADREVVQSIASYCEKPNVPECHGPMERYLTAPLVSFDTAPWAAYQSPIDGEVIDSRAKRNEHMAKHGVVLFDEIKPDFERARKAAAEAHKKDLREDLIAATHKVLDHNYKPQVESVDNIVPTTSEA